MKKFFTPINIVYLLLFSFVANSFALIRLFPLALLAIIPIFIFINALAGTVGMKGAPLRLIICRHGGVMLGVFAFSLIISIVHHVVLAFVMLPISFMTFIGSAILCFSLSAILFWNGIICVYCTSVQLGIKLRVIGALCGMIPIANLIALGKILSTVMNEVDFEWKKEKLNASRASESVCKTKYPILLVHGIFFRDSNYFNYWGRVPKELERNGATVFYGEHQSALSIEDSAKELAERIKAIVAESGCERLNIIAHSKGGLDCRCAISELDISPYVASLTTINTPHKGCLFADRLLESVPSSVTSKIADTYNTALKKLGDDSPDFITAVTDLTRSACESSTKNWTFPDGIFSQSFGSKLNRATDGQFPLNLSYRLVKHYDGANDGLVGEESFPWGERFELLTVQGDRGISHGDMIDLNRENIDGFDVREFYVRLANDLKRRGL